MYRGRKQDGHYMGLGLGETEKGNQKVGDFQSLYLFSCRNRDQSSLSKHILPSKKKKKLLMRT